MNDEQRNVLEDQIGPAAVACERAVGCPAELTAAQAILESGWLDKAPENNCFGIKAHASVAGRQLLTTTEWFTDQEAAAFLARGDEREAEPVDPPQVLGTRKKYHVKDWFAAYPDLAACFADHAGVLQAPVYAPTWTRYREDGDLEAFIRGIAAHYATDPGYADTILRLARDATVAAAIAASRNSTVAASGAGASA
jgi:flagellum-specific peptidoglycan hydrolase FlgJ